MSRNIKTEERSLTVAIVIHCRYVVFEKIFEDFPNKLLGRTLQSSCGHTIDQVTIVSTMNTGYSCLYQDDFIARSQLYAYLIFKMFIFFSKMSQIISSILILVPGPSSYFDSVGLQSTGYMRSSSEL